MLSLSLSNSVGGFGLKDSVPPITSYLNRLNATDTANQILNLHYDETSGTTVTDYSTNLNNQTTTGTRNGDTFYGIPATTTTKAGGCTVANSAAYLAMSMNLGTVVCWVKVANAAYWNAGNSGTIFKIQNFSLGGQVIIEKGASANQIQFIDDYLNIVTCSTCSDLDWFCLAMTWDQSANELEGWIDGVKIGTVAKSNTSNTPQQSFLYGNPGGGWNGSVGPMVVWDKVLSDTDIISVSSI